MNFNSENACVFIPFGIRLRSMAYAYLTVEQKQEQVSNFSEKTNVFDEITRRQWGVRATYSLYCMRMVNVEIAIKLVNFWCDESRVSMEVFARVNFHMVFSTCAMLPHRWHFLNYYKNIFVEVSNRSMCWHVSPIQCEKCSVAKPKSQKQKKNKKLYGSSRSKCSQTTPSGE